ncbi:hypothetical protein [Vibrio coralliilyticus]|uniref:hypothetical protein n=1 Tax=Vibrio coralliilyticus TaxID=190893 RepID=UPI0017C4EB3C|nr:hypothetical protein [Vibrio coralliilyticus]NUW66926.1 hypothetical protein [Vibrio coralliilyticus]NUW70896.1 hypothetical protein [Vibrio coralliilyticus]
MTKQRNKRLAIVIAYSVFDDKERQTIAELKRAYQATFEAFMLKLDALYSDGK